MDVAPECDFGAQQYHLIAHLVVTNPGGLSSYAGRRLFLRGNYSVVDHTVGSLDRTDPRHDFVRSGERIPDGVGPYGRASSQA